MTREIKLRAWYRESMYRVSRMEWSDRTEKLSDVSLAHEVHGSIMNTYWFSSTKDPIEIMQFTGLKDKNGKEIYEGDIVHSEPGDAATPQPNRVYQVVYHAPGFVLRGLDGTVGPVWGLGEASWRENGFNEIIGNVHENPELLKETTS